MADLLTRLGAGLKGFFNGFKSPGEPIKATMPKGTTPMGLDYPYGYNLNTTPRSEELIGFEELRALADNYDLLRLAIEKRKNQIEALDWNIVPIDKRIQLLSKSAMKYISFLNVQIKSYLLDDGKELYLKMYS